MTSNLLMISLLVTIMISLTLQLQLAYSQPGGASSGVLNATGMVPAEDIEALQPFQNECGPVFSCAYFVYSSPNILVILGDESIVSANPDEPAIPIPTDNVGLWKIVDYYIDKGFTVNAVILKEQGDPGGFGITQDQYRIIMSKQPQQP